MDGFHGAAQMERDGIKKLRVWAQPVRGIQRRIERPKCGHPGCKVIAKYDTPAGVRCFSHALPQEDM